VRLTARHRLWARLDPPRLFVVSFAALVALGTLGLKLLPGLYTGEPLSWLDALFTATSAVCVTGLIVVDTATYFTPAGQAFLLLLIQLGGLGIVAFTTLIILALGRRLPLHHEALSSSGTEVSPHLDFRTLGRDVVLFTLVFEALGFLALWLLWVPRFGPVDAAWPALFHAVSAFCNAGFSVFSDSLMGFQRGPWSLAVIMALILVGGIGFITMSELRLLLKGRRARRAVRLSLHSKLALSATAVLLVLGWVGFAIFEWQNTLSELPAWSRAMNALFMSVTARTAGFNTVSYAQASESSNFFSILLMSVGGSPGSTAGGLKTTTAAVIVLLAIARLRGEGVVNVWGRTIPSATVERAVGLFVVVFALVALATFTLTAAELGHAAHPDAAGGLLMFMFEAASAFNTVGLSMGATPELGTVGRWVVILLMFVGRVGPVTFVAALVLRRTVHDRHFRYAHEDVITG